MGRYRSHNTIITLNITDNDLLADSIIAGHDAVRSILMADAETREHTTTMDTEPFASTLLGIVKYRIINSF